MIEFRRWQRRSGDDRRWTLITRARLAGIFCMVMALTQGAIALAAGSEELHAWLESLASGIIFIGGAVLVLVRDPRCNPKIERVNAILVAALRKRLGVKPSDLQE